MPTALERRPLSRHAADPVGAAASVAESRASDRVLADAPNRRGPFRPKTLVSARARRAALLEFEFLRLADGLALFGAALIAALMALGLSPLHMRVNQALPFLAAALVGAWTLDQMGFYRIRLAETWAVRLGRLAIGLGAGLAAGVTAALLARTPFAAERGLWVWMLLAAVATALLNTLVSVELRRWRDSGKLTPNVVIVGATAQAERLIRTALERRDVNVLGVFDDRLARSPEAVAGVPVLGDVAALIGHRILPHVDRVVVAIDPAARTRARDLSKKLSVLPNEITLLVDLEDDGRGAAALSRLADSVFAPPLGAAEETRRVFAKRLQDLVIATTALVLLSPLLALAALAVRLESPGPVFFRQRRHGFNNETIVVWKFRSMRQEAADATASRQVSAGDDRITRVGRVLRSTSIDELPQLINVLSGEMSLVGPRPHAIGMKTGEAESALLVAEYAWRHRMKPGLTGWAAIHGSRGPLHTPEEVRRRVSLDIEYVERQSFWLDLRIMLLTVPCLLGDAGKVR
jgi:Undecaprenyl-phosphate glucose phosphotransferase